MPDKLEGLPNSAKSVYQCLQEKGPLRAIELVKLTLLSPRTTRTALKRLQERRLVRRYPDLQDTRSYLYKVKN